MSAKLFKLFVVLFIAVVSLSACSGNVADNKANCKAWDGNFVDENKDGKADSPVSCEKVAEKAEEAIDQTRKARIEGVCYDIASQNTQGGKPVVVKNGAKWQYKWVDAFGQGNQDCWQAAPWAYFDSLFQAGKVVAGK